MHEFSISTLLKVKRLKLTTVQTAYTWQEPLNKDLFLGDGDSSSNVKAKIHIKSGSQYFLFISIRKLW